MAVNVSKAPAGSGKTREFLKRIALSPRTVEVYVPTHALAEEWRQEVHKCNPTRRVAVIRGRDFELQPGLHLCQRQAEAAMLTSSGISIFPNLCLRRNGPGQPPDLCPNYGGCGYISQFQNAEVRIFTHAYLPLNRGILDEAMPSVVIIDEAFHSSLINDITVPLALLTGPGVPAPAQQLCRDVVAAITSGARLDQRLASARGQRGELNAAIAALEVKPALLPSQSAAMHRMMLAGHINYQPVIALLRQLDREMTVRAIPQSITFDSHGNLVLHQKREVTRFTRPDGSQPDIFILDAGADIQIVRQFFPGAIQHKMDLPRNAHVVQCHSTTSSTTSLVPAKSSDPSSADRARKRLRGIEKLLVRLAVGGAMVLVVGPTAVVGNSKTQQPPLISVPPGCDLAHFNALRGINRWKDFNVVVVLGRNQPPVTAVENMARAIFLMDPAPLRLSGHWTNQKRGYRLRNGQLGVDVTVHRDSRVQAILEQVREGESLQAVDRLRLVHSTRQKTVVLLSSLVLDIDVDETRTWNDLVQGSRLEQAWATCNGTLPLNPDWLAAKFTNLWPTPAAAKKDIGRASKKGQLSNGISLRKMSLFQHHYRLPGQRRWSGCLSEHADPKPVALALTSLVGAKVIVC